MSVRLHWRWRGFHNEPVSEFADRTHHVRWRARRGAFLAEVYLRPDGEWGWIAGRLNSPRIGAEGKASMCLRPCACGFSSKRRRAQRACLKQMRAMR